MDTSLNHPAPKRAPNDAKPNVAQLKADHHQDRSNAKVEELDPGLSMLGTDDEAGGAPMSEEAIALARRQEQAQYAATAESAPTGARANASQSGPSTSQVAIEEAEEDRFSPVLALALAGGALLLGGVLFLMA